MWCRLRCVPVPEHPSYQHPPSPLLQYLEDEIDAAAAAAPSREDSLSAEEAARRLNTVNIRTLGSSPTNWSVPAADSRRGLGQEVAAPDTDADADDACSVQSSDIAGLDLATAPHFSPTPSWRGRGKSPSPAPSSAQVQEGRGMGPGEGPSDADRTGSLRPHSRPGSNDALEDLDWLGRLQRAAFSATSSAYQGTLALLQPVAASRNADQGGPSSGVNPADQAPDAAGVATGVGLVLLALAVYAERDVLKRSVASVGRGVARGLAELAAMGLSLTPNPMAHSPVNRPR